MLLWWFGWGRRMLVLLLLLRKRRRCLRGRRGMTTTDGVLLLLLAEAMMIVVEHRADRLRASRRTVGRIQRRRQPHDVIVVFMPTAPTDHGRRFRRFVGQAVPVSSLLLLGQHPVLQPSDVRARRRGVRRCARAAGRRHVCRMVWLMVPTLLLVTASA